MNLQPVQNNIPATTSFEDKISFIKRRRRGESIDRLQAHVEQHQQQMVNKIQEFTEILLTRQNQAEKNLQELIEEAKSIDFLIAYRSQCENLQQTLTQLQQVNIALTIKLEDGEKNFELLYRGKMALQASIDKLKQQLNSSKSQKFGFQEPMYQAGENLSQYIYTQMKR